MIGRRDPQNELFDVGNVFALSLSPSSFHGQMAKAGPKLFADEDFAAFYDEKHGRPSVPPSLLALATILQQEAKVSDEEAIQRTAFDLRWAAVLGKPAGDPLCAKSTLQLFRAHLIIHEEVRKIFGASIKEAKRAGLLKGKAMRIATDTKPIQGRGAVEDTYNLLATGIRQLGSAIAKSLKAHPGQWMQENGLSRYTEPSIKGSADIDWSNSKAREALITQIVSDARRLLGMACGSDTKVREAGELLGQLLLQDVEEGSNESQVRIKKGMSKDRIPSATDPQQRHGRKSESRVFVGSKASIANDVDSQIIVAVDVIPGNAGDSTGVLSLVEQAEADTGEQVEEVIADCAYGSGETRQSFADAGRTLVAKVPKEPDRGGFFPKSAFEIDLEAGTVACPNGHTSTEFIQFSDGRKVFGFGGACWACPLRSKCTNAPRGRTISVHPQESLLAEARAYQQTPEGRARLRERTTVEHRLARLSQLGIGQARYKGLAKTRFQLIMAATIANLRRTWNWEQSPHTGQAVSSVSEAVGLVFCAAVRIIYHRLSRFVQFSAYCMSGGILMAARQNCRFRLGF